eukprot:gene20794-40685_t
MMKVTKKHIFEVFLISTLSIIVVLIGSWTTFNDEDNGWGIYKGDEKSTSYSKFDQINLSNVSTLQNAWTFQMNDVPQGGSPMSSQSNPIIVDGIMYANSGKQWVYAINAQTGKQIWAFNALAEGEPTAASRGVTYWANGEDKRIIYSAGNYLLTINAKTGKLITSLGQKGK